MVRFGYQSQKLLKYLGVEIKNPNHLDNLFAEFEPVEIPKDAVLLDDSRYIVISQNNKDKGQRIACGCMKSKDIGEYNTCPHLCEYCYANTSKESAVRNWNQHKLNPQQDTITGR